jgi:hypothetical protein
MAEWRQTEETGPGETHSPPLTPEQFKKTREFLRFKAGMREILRMSKAKLDERVEDARATSPRVDNPNAPGRKRKPHES